RRPGADLSALATVAVTGQRLTPHRMLSKYCLMLCLHLVEDSTWLLQILVSAFLAILFLQSGIDKLVDRRGNLEFLRGHFSKSPLAGMVPILVTLITVLEVAAGVLSAIGCAIIIL